MVRTILLVALLGATGYVAFQWIRDSDQKTGPRGKDRRSGDAKTAPVVDSGSDKGSTPSQAHAETQVIPVKSESIVLSEPIVLPDARISLVQAVDVASQRTGRIQFMGVELKPGTKADPTKIAKQKLYFLAVKVKQNEPRKPKEDYFTVKDELWRRWQDGDPIEPNNVRLLAEEKQYVPLMEGMTVAKGDLLGIIDHRVARAELEIKIVQIKAAQADLRATEKLRDEYETRYRRAEKALQNGSGSVEDRDGARASWEKLKEDVIGKEAALEKAAREIQQAETVMKLHEIAAPISGTVKRIQKQEGESVKEQDTILRIENADQLQVEGVVEIQVAERLRRGEQVVIEPTKPETYVEKLSEHRDPITAVAVAHLADGQVRIVSASEDRSVRIWGLEVKKEKDPEGGDRERWKGKQLLRLEHPAVIRSLAVTPRGAARSLLVTGSADGVGQIWDIAALSKPKPSPIDLKPTHRGAVLAVALSRDGKWCPTGGEDKTLNVWDTLRGTLLHSEAAAHKGAVTSLSFAPGNRLVSVGSDSRIVHWSLDGAGKLKLIDQFDQRSGQVEQLGVHPDGKTVLVDKGSRLGVLGLENWSTEGFVQSVSANFSTFALFSPDGRMVLSAASSDNRLQLWSNPVLNPRRRAVELRQYVWNEAPATCAAFGTDAVGGTFAVTGMRDRNLLLWKLPPESELKEPEANAVLRSIGEGIDTGQRQVRIIADIVQKNRRLIPNDKANIVIYPR